MDNSILIINNSDLKEVDGSTPVARYIPYKYLEDLINNQLYFRNCELFTDDNERKRLDRGNFKNSRALNIASKTNGSLKSNCRAYVSCWTLFDKGENFALWKIYDKKGTGACIVTTVRKLKEQLNPNILIGRVDYDEKVNIPWLDITGVGSNYMAEEFVKIEPYFFEKEVRVVFYSNSKEDGLYQTIDFASLIDEVYLSPFANDKCKQKIKKLLCKKVEIDKIKPSIISESLKINKV